MWKVILHLNLAALCIGVSVSTNNTASVSPNNTAVIVGQRMEMECRAGNGSIVRSWSYLSPSNSHENYIFTHNRGVEKNYSHIGVDVDNNSSGILFINISEKKDAGIYSCSVERGNTQSKYSAHLIVFESEPLCLENFTLNENGSLTEGDHIWMQCNFTYQGALNPTMEWRLHDGGNDSTVPSAIRVINGSSLASTIVITVGSYHNASFFSCRTFFALEDSKLTGSIAKNNPEFNHVFTFPVIILSDKRAQSTSDHFHAPTSVNGTTFRTTTVNSLPNVYTDWFFISVALVALVALLFIVIAAVVCVYCLKRVRNSSDYLDSSKGDFALRKNNTYSGAYDMIGPFDSATDYYDPIDETKITEEMELPAIRRAPLPPTTGYSTLVPATEVPADYRKIETYEIPVEKESTSDEIPSDYLITNAPNGEVPVCSEKRNSTTAGDEADSENVTVPGEISSEYLTTRPESLKIGNYEEPIPSSNIESNGYIKLDCKGTLAAERQSDDNIELLSAYLTMENQQ